MVMASMRSTRFYSDNKNNRALGRVGLPIGSVHWASTQMHIENSKRVTRSCYVDNASNRSIGRAGMEIGTKLTYSQPKNKDVSRRAAVDDRSNRRVSLVITKCDLRPCKSQTQDRRITKPAKAQRRNYADNLRNRMLNRVGLPYGTKAAKTPNGHNVAVSAPKQNQNMDIAQIFVSSNPDRRDLLEEAMALTFGNTPPEASTSAHAARPTHLPQSKILQFSDLGLGKKLGDGTFGEVYAAKWLGENDVAVKKLKVDVLTKREISKFVEEVDVVRSLEHPAIVRFYGACITLPNIALVIEFMPAGSLYKVLHEDNILLTSEQKNNIIADALSALTYLHSVSVAHRDIKSGNVMMCEDMNHCKLTDFGLAVKGQETNKILKSNNKYPAVGTFAYCSPEVLNGDRLSLKELMEADVYSMAMMILEVLSGKRPFYGVTPNKIRNAVWKGTRPYLNSTPMTNDMYALLKNCLSKTTILRPSAKAFWKTFIGLMSD